MPLRTRRAKSSASRLVGRMQPCDWVSHLGLSAHERRSKAKKLLDIAGQTPTTTVILGDINDWFWAGPVRAALAREFPGRTLYPTFPSWLPLLRLDRIYCQPARALLGSRVEMLARHVSDHICVVAEIKPRV